MDVLWALDYVRGAAETGRPQEVSGAIGGLVVAPMAQGKRSYIQELLELRNRLSRDERRDYPAVEAAFESLWRLVKGIERQAEVAARSSWRRPPHDLKDWPSPARSSAHPVDNGPIDESSLSYL
jgi:hypothetical protein